MSGKTKPIKRVELVYKFSNPNLHKLFVDFDVAKVAVIFIASILAVMSKVFVENSNVEKKIFLCTAL